MGQPRRTWPRLTWPTVHRTDPTPTMWQMLGSILFGWAYIHVEGGLVDIYRVHYGSNSLGRATPHIRLFTFRSIPLSPDGQFNDHNIYNFERWVPLLGDIKWP